MSEDINRVLALLAEQPSQGGVSVSFIAERLGLDHRRVQKIVEMLERAAYVRVEHLDRVSLVTLTPLGIEKAGAWHTERPEKHWFKRAPALVNVLGVGLVTVVVGVFGYWFGVGPPTNGPQSAESARLLSATLDPVDTAKPIFPATATPSPTMTASPTATATSTSTSTPTKVPPTATNTPEGLNHLPTAIPYNTPDPLALGPQPTAIPTPIPLLEQPENAINIVLMGTDTTQGSWRTDTLIVVSIDPHLPSVSMLSIPRDLYVYIPGWKMSRINTADYHGEKVEYPGGGPGLVKATIEYNLGIRVHYFARVDFQGFVNILDTLGGVDVVADCELHDTFPDPAAAGGSTDIDLLPGVHHLNGKQALWYARSRWNTNDYDRGRRQQRVLRGALAQIKQLGLLSKLPELWEELTQTVDTDLSLETALWLATLASRMDNSMAIKSRFIDNTVIKGWHTPEGASVLLPIYEKIGPLVAEALAPPDTARARQRLTRVEVLNGTNWSNWGILATDRLLWEGFDVVKIEQAERTDYRQTTIVDLTDTVKGSPVAYMADVLQVNGDNVLSAGEPGDDVDFRVIVGYDYRPCYRSYWRKVHSPTPTSAP